MRLMLGTILSVLLFVVFTSIASFAGCVDYWYIGDVNCTGAGGCQSSHPLITCSFGCVSGTCVHNGGGGECCGKPYSVPVIYPDGQSDCHGECGAAGVYSPPTASEKHPHAPEIKQGYTPGLVVLNSNVSYRPDVQIYVFDRCNHSYDVMQQEPLFIKGAM